MTLNLVRSQKSPLGGATIHSNTNLEFHKALEPEGGGEQKSNEVGPFRFSLGRICSNYTRSHPVTPCSKSIMKVFL